MTSSYCVPTAAIEGGRQTDDREISGCLARVRYTRWSRPDLETSLNHHSSVRTIGSRGCLWSSPGTRKASRAPSRSGQAMLDALSPGLDPARTCLGLRLRLRAWLRWISLVEGGHFTFSFFCSCHYISALISTFRFIRDQRAGNGFISNNKSSNSVQEGVERPRRRRRRRRRKNVMIPPRPQTYFFAYTCHRTKVFDRYGLGLRE
ncbi:hypothetical protein B0T20DRAFT_90388 [Sordaria brevicollis]|uniref:Uncharacterized protein n=1 Tax=Sordaria brevicollis TaxID=83679 RepID=A0AAE0U377_SORBR|nr:hypothetical protein B0T20DRAFT_90388 [Sordaria brevicollis]